MVAWPCSCLVPHPRACMTTASGQRAIFWRCFPRLASRAAHHFNQRAQQLEAQTLRPAVSVCAELAWHDLAYLDPGRVWMPLPSSADGQRAAELRQQQRLWERPVLATVLASARVNGQEGVPPPASVTVSKGRALLPSGLYDGGRSSAAVAVREYGTVRPLGGPDGSYSVFERVEYAEAARRDPAAAAAMKRARTFAGVAAMGGGQEPEGGNGGDAPPGADGRAVRGGVAGFTMGTRTRTVLPGQALEHPDAAQLPGPGQYDVGGTVGAGKPSFTLKGRPQERPAEQASWMAQAAGLGSLFSAAGALHVLVQAGGRVDQPSPCCCPATADADVPWRAQPCGPSPVVAAHACAAFSALPPPSQRMRALRVAPFLPCHATERWWLLAPSLGW
eukprot:364714-Chlamydomonas_euryale.AAC.6